MHALARHVVAVPDFPKPGILFRDITPLLRAHFTEVVAALEALFGDAEWAAADAVAGVESRGFILAAALAERRRKGFVPIRKKGKLPPPVVDRSYDLEYGSGVLEMQRGRGRLLVVDDVLATDAGFEVTGLGVLIDLGIAPDFRFRTEPARAVIRYGG